MEQEKLKKLEGYRELNIESQESIKRPGLGQPFRDWRKEEERTNLKEELRVMIENGDETIISQLKPGERLEITKKN